MSASLIDDKSEYASFTARLIALLIDLVSLIPFIFIHFYNLYILKSLTLHIVIWLLVAALKVGSELLFTKSLGKKLLKLEIITDTFARPSLIQILHKNVLFLLHVAGTLVTGIFIVNNLITDDSTQLAFDTYSTIFLVGITLLYGVNFFIISISALGQSMLEFFAKLRCRKVILK